MPTLLAVTVLTSWEEQRLQGELAIAQAIAERVPALAQLSATVGIGGCVYSPLEAAALRALPSPSFERQAFAPKVLRWAIRLG